MKIVTSYNPPPGGSTHQFDWSAIDDDTYEPDSPIGYGRTEQEAIEDLLEQIEERRP
jgi:hypothetical protein